MRAGVRLRIGLFLRPPRSLRTKDQILGNEWGGVPRHLTPSGLELDFNGYRKCHPRCRPRAWRLAADGFFHPAQPLSRYDVLVLAAQIRPACFDWPQALARGLPLEQILPPSASN